MRKIDKSKQFSTVYKTWENGLEANNTPHPSYNSSNGEYYKDIVMDALRCQNGLCAYTEIQLCAPLYLTAENWENGRYKGIIEGRVHNGQLEHFDEQLKWKNKKNYQHKDWLWANFFVIESDINNLKSTKTIDYILKPDAKGYDPFILLDYSGFTHEYIPNSELSEDDKTRVNNMIDILGLNFPNLLSKRRQVVEWIIKYPLEKEMEIQFPTAVEFCKRR
jgi:hypothetical protein